MEWSPESAAWARGAICWTVSVQMIQSAKRESIQRWDSLLDPVTFYEWWWDLSWLVLCCHKSPNGCDVIIHNRLKFDVSVVTVLFSFNSLLVLAALCLVWAPIMCIWERLYICCCLQRDLSVSHNPSETILICWFAAQHFSLLSMLKCFVLQLNIFVETMIPLKHLYKILTRERNQ